MDIDGDRMRPDPGRKCCLGRFESERRRAVANDQDHARVDGSPGYVDERPVIVEMPGVGVRDVHHDRDVSVP
jgi:hypothetical protein